MKDLLNEFIKTILVEKKQKPQVAPQGSFAGNYGKYYSTNDPTKQGPATYLGRVTKGQWVAATPKDKATQAAPDKNEPDKPPTTQPVQAPDQPPQQVSAFDSIIKGLSSDSESFYAVPLYLKVKRKGGGYELNTNKLSDLLTKWFESKNIKSDDIPQYLNELQQNGIDLVPMITSNSSMDHGAFIKFKTVSDFSKSLSLDPNSPALSNLLPGYLRFFSPTLFKNTKIDNHESRKVHLNHFLGANGKGTKTYFSSIKVKARSIIYKESEIKKVFLATQKGNDIIYDVLAKEFKVDAPFKTEADEQAWLSTQSSKTKKLYSATKSAILETLFPTTDTDSDEIETYERNQMNGLLKGLSAFSKYTDRRSVLEKIDRYREAVENSIAEKKPYLKNLDRSFRENISNYNATLTGLAEKLNSLESPSQEDFAAAKQMADDALKVLFTMPEDVVMTTEEKKDYVKTLRGLFAKLAESHEFYRELLNGEEVYLPEFQGFPCGDKLKVSREPEHVKIERVSVKSGDNESKTGAQSEFGKYPFWKGVYKKLGMGVMGWQNKQPFQLPRDYADNEEYFNEALQDSGVIEAGVMSSDSAAEFRNLVVTLQRVATENSDDESHLDEDGNKKKDNFNGDVRLQAYASAPSVGEDLSLETSRKLFAQVKETLDNSAAIGKDSFFLDRIDNTLHQGDSYLGYMLETLAATFGEDESIQILKDRRIFAEKKIKGVPLLDIPKTMENVSEKVFEKYFDLPRLKDFLGDDNYKECLRRGPMYAMAAIATSGALKAHDGFAGVVSHRHYILNTTQKNRDLRIKEYYGLPAVRDWGLTLNLFQTRNGRWELSNHKAGFGAAVRITCKGKSELRK